MNKFYIGITDDSWYKFLSRQPGLDLVNFWRPSVENTFRALNPGELFLFKLHSPNDYIVGGGYFAQYIQLPISQAWERFGIANGASSLLEMSNIVEKYRGEQMVINDGSKIGCILLKQPFYFPNGRWLNVPDDWKPSIQSGRSYDLSTEIGKNLNLRVRKRLYELNRL